MDKNAVLILFWLAGLGSLVSFCLTHLVVSPACRPVRWSARNLIHLGFCTKEFPEFLSADLQEVSPYFFSLCMFFVELTPPLYMAFAWPIFASVLSWKP